ncbi:MAG TPA: carboxypeptidase regulatory-like domain-containing protein [Bryobacteraceae bacterium]|nr:carboxypeptidase regulatory-like domain-containing protein [Bryobacteraceae bacterium]
MSSRKQETTLRSRLAFAFLGLALLLCNSSAKAQVTTADVLGTVTDPSGGALPNATVVLTNTGTQSARTQQSNAGGEYTFTQLESGSYSISVSAAGFKTFVLRQFSLSAGDRHRQDISMSLGQNSQTVEVTATPPSLDTDSSALSSIVTNKQVEDLPLNGRNFVQLAQLAAGATEAQPGAISNGNRPDDRRQTAAVSVNAQSDTLNNELVDGLDNNEASIGSIGVRPSVDAISEFRVATNLYPAEAGKTPGAVINLITKSGTNEFHGSAYEFLRNDALDARDFFATIGPKPEYRQNQFGGSIGGPIRKNKTFFFGDYEGLRIVQGTTSVSTVPTLFEEQNPGNLSDIGGRVIPASQLDPIALKFLALYPAPNLPGTINNFTYSPNVTQFSHTVDGRVDQHFSEKDNFFARFTYNNVATNTPSGLPAVNGIEPGGNVSYPGVANETAQQILLNHIHIFSPTLIMELKAGYTRINNASYPLNYGTNAAQQLGIQNANINMLTSALSNVSITGYAGLGDSTYLPLIYLDNTFQYGGSLTQTKGAHTLKYGAILIRRQVENQQNTSGVGSFTFNTSPSNFPLENFLLGDAYQVSRIMQLQPRYLRDWEPSFFIQDDWRVTKSLTVNLGLRYDIITPWVDVHNQISNFNPATASVIAAGVNGASRTAGVKTDYGSVGPRVGFAYNVRQGTVLRGGYGRVYFRDSTSPSLPYTDPPFVTTYSPNPMTVSLSTPLPLPTAQSTLSGALRGIQLDYKNSYVDQTNVNLEQSFGATVVTVGYVGEFGRRLRMNSDLNLATPSPVSYVTRRPLYGVLPNVTSALEMQSNGYSDYNGLQVSVQRRLSRGITAAANYTWSHAISDVQTYSQGGSFSSAIPSQNATLERANSDLDVRQRFTLMLNYELPFGKSLTGWRGTAIKDWQLNAIDVWETGFPFSVTNSSPRSNTGVSADRPNEIANPVLNDPSISEWFNTAAFQPQALGTIGSAARNAVYGPHFRHFDLSLFKTFQLAEGLHLQFRAEAYNLTNTPNFNQPNGSLGSTSFGTISSTRTGSTPRQLQFALRFMF